MSFDTPIPPYNASDPLATFVSFSCLDLLMTEMVPLAERMARRDERREAGIMDVDVDGGDGAGPGARARAFKAKEVDGGGGGGEGEVFRDAVFFRLDGLGYRVGQGLSERFSRDRPRFVDNLDVIKFLCKDLWTILFKKQIDNLKTNHRGVYVLTDGTFRPFLRMSMKNNAEAVARAQPEEEVVETGQGAGRSKQYLFFPCGIIRGALSSMGIPATVQAESTTLPQAVFQIKTTIASRP